MHYKFVVGEKSCRERESVRVVGHHLLKKDKLPVISFDPNLCLSIMARFSLLLKAYFFRAIQSVFVAFDLYLSHPLPRRVSFSRTITTNIPSVPGQIKLAFYTPLSYSRVAINREGPSSSTAPVKKHPLLINFHGGGFTIGNARDDARWATAVISDTNAVVVSVGYRLAPEYPFPIGIEDCVSAIFWLWKHADEYNLDITKTAFSGFSAGGNLAYAVSIRLSQEIERLRREDKVDGAEFGRLVSLVVFYGSTDWTQTRAERDASNPNLISAIPPVLFNLFDDGYLSAKPDMASPLLSPGLAPEEVLREALPHHLVLINCGGDQLLAESERFKSKLEGLGKNIDGYVVEGVPHGWDKKPTFKKGDVKRDQAYQHAVTSLQKTWELV